MIAPYQRPAYIYGEILTRGYQSRDDISSIGTFVSQGAAGGALLGFASPVIGMLLHPENGYNFLLISYLPEFLGWGMLFGLCEGAAFWASTFVVGRRIHPVVRAVLGIVILVLLIAAYHFIFLDRPPYQRMSLMDYLYSLRVYAPFGMVLGLLIGSRFRPLYELIRGTATDRWPGLSGISGLLLRVVVIFSLMVSILNLILSLQGDFRRAEFVFAVIAVIHFAVAVLIIFARIPYWLLLPLAIVINFPIVALITDVLTADEVEKRVITLIYLHLWAAFLLCRLSVPRWTRSFRKEL